MGQSTKITTSHITHQLQIYFYSLNMQYMESVSHLPSPPAVPPSFRDEAPTTTPTTLHQYGGA